MKSFSLWQSQVECSVVYLFHARITSLSAQVLYIVSVIFYLNAGPIKKKHKVAFLLW